MKKLIIIWFIFLFGTKLQAQTPIFAPVGAEWWYSGGDPVSWSEIWDYAKVTKDTLIQGQICRKIEAIRHQKYLFNPQLWVSSLGNIYLFDQNDTIFTFNSLFNKFTPIFTFNVNVGDTVCMPVTAGYYAPNIHPLTGDTSFCFVIDSITPLFGNSSYQAYHINSIYEKDANDIYVDANYPALTWGRGNADQGQGLFVKGLGGLSGILPSRIIPIDMTHLPIYRYLICYRDSSTDFSSSGRNCAEELYGFVGVDNKTANKFEIQIYPNPSNSLVTLSFPQVLPKGTVVSVLDMAGRRLIPKIEPGGQSLVTIDVRNLPIGMCVVEVLIDGYYYRYKLIVAR